MPSAGILRVVTNLKSFEFEETLISAFWPVCLHTTSQPACAAAAAQFRSKPRSARARAMRKTTMALAAALQEYSGWMDVYSNPNSLRSTGFSKMNGGSLQSCRQEVRKHFEGFKSLKDCHDDIQTCST